MPVFVFNIRAAWISVDAIWIQFLLNKKEGVLLFISLSEKMFLNGMSLFFIRFEI